MIRNPSIGSLWNALFFGHLATGQQHFGYLYTIPIYPDQVFEFQEVVFIFLLVEDLELFPKDVLKNSCDTQEHTRSGGDRKLK